MTNSDVTMALPAEDYERIRRSVASETGKSLEAWVIDSPRDAYMLLLGHIDPNNTTSIRHNEKLKTSPQTRDATAKLAAYVLANEFPDPTQEIRVEVHVYLSSSELAEGFKAGTIPVPSKAEQKNWKMPTRLAIGFTVHPQKS